MAAHSRVLAWRGLQTEEPGGATVQGIAKEWNTNEQQEQVTRVAVQLLPQFNFRVFSVPPPPKKLHAPEPPLPTLFLLSSASPAAEDLLCMSVDLSVLGVSRKSYVIWPLVTWFLSLLTVFSRFTYVVGCVHGFLPSYSQILLFPGSVQSLGRV